MRDKKSTCFIAGAALVLLTVFLLPQGLVALGEAAGAGVGPGMGSWLLVGAGTLTAVAGVVLLIVALVLRWKSSRTVRTYADSKDFDPRDARERRDWAFRPVNHMGENQGPRRD